eukprot:6558968-Heterocapsa_arctica.AAC.1
MDVAAAVADPDLPIKDGDIVPDRPPPMTLPPSQRVSIDTVEHNQMYYLPRDMGLEEYTVEKDGDRTLGSLTTRQCMMLRRFWGPPGDPKEVTIPSWSSHLTHACCKGCMSRIYSNIDGTDRLCIFCGQPSMVFAYEDLQPYDKDKDDMARGLKVLKNSYFVPTTSEQPKLIDAASLRPERDRESSEQAALTENAKRLAE